MFWREVTTPAELEEYVDFEQTVFPSADWLTFNDYELWMEQKGLRIFLLTVNHGIQQRRTPAIVGSFNVFVEDNVAYMGGFATGLEQRGFRLTRKLMDKLLEEFGKYEIVCKTHPKDYIMKKVLTRGGFTNKLDKFEKGRIWSYWSRLP